jgi:hypothetical protein
MGFQNVSATHSGTTVTATAASGDSFYINTNNYVTVSGCSDPTYNQGTGVHPAGTQGSTTLTYVVTGGAPSTGSTTGCLIMYVPPNSAADYATQNLRGANFISTITTILGATFTADNVAPYASYDIWEMYPSFGQGGSFGLKSQRGNSYDGNEDVTASVSCSAPEAAYSCGGELQNYGNFIGSVKTANAAIDKAITSLHGPAPIGAAELLSAETQGK